MTVFLFLTCGDGTLAEFDNTPGTPGLDGTGIPAGPLDAWGSPGFTVGGIGPEPPGPMLALDCIDMKCKENSQQHK